MQNWYEFNSHNEHTYKLKLIIQLIHFQLYSTVIIIQALVWKNRVRKTTAVIEDYFDLSFIFSSYLKA